MSKKSRRRNYKKKHIDDEFLLKYINKPYKEGTTVVVSDTCKLNAKVVTKVSGYDYRNGYIYLDCDKENSYFPGIIYKYDIFYYINQIRKKIKGSWL